MPWLFLVGALGLGIFYGGWRLFRAGSEILGRNNVNKDLPTGFAGGVTKLIGVVVMVIGGLMVAAALLLPLIVVQG